MQTSVFKATLTCHIDAGGAERGGLLQLIRLGRGGGKHSYFVRRESKKPQSKGSPSCGAADPLVYSMHFQQWAFLLSHNGLNPRHPHTRGNLLTSMAVMV